MSIPDIIILLFIVAGAIRGYITGFILQILTLVAFFGGIWVCIKYNHIAAAYLDKLYDINDDILPYITFFLLFVILLILVQLIGMLITALLDKTPLGIPNRLAGAFFGAAKFILILSVVMLLLNKFDLKREWMSNQQLEKSKLYEPIEKIAPAILPKLSVIQKKVETEAGKGMR